jgi:ribosome-binding factor A
MRSRSTGRQPQKAPGQRQLRVGERIRHILSEVLRRGELHDPVLENSGLITVTVVSVSPDLKNAMAYVMPLGGKNVDAVVAALNKAAGYFRTELSHDLGLRHTPKIAFKVDNSFDEADHIDRLLRQPAVRRDVEKPDTPDDT